MALATEPYNCFCHTLMNLLEPLRESSKKVCNTGPGWKQPADSFVGLELSRAGSQDVGRMGLVGF